MKRWMQIYKSLANLNRLRVIKFLSDGKERTVTQVAAEINISLRAISRHLIILDTMDILRSVGKEGHVFYSINPHMPADVKKVINPFLKS